MSIRIVAVLGLAVAAGALHAQQFVQQIGAVPGPIVWSEAVETFDADQDGDLDVIYSNGTGFSSAQGALAPTLLINQGAFGTAGVTFADETSTRIPAGFTQQGKAMTVCDVDQDGDEDIVFGNAFNNQPKLLINNGAGVFSDQTSTRFPVVMLNCFGVAFGDADQDGDLDLAFSDMGSGAGGLWRLFVNNGAGVFTLAPQAQTAAVVKVGAMDSHFVDIDNDFDLDVIIDGKSSGQQLYKNNGAGFFTYFASVLPAGSGSTYATDWSDLDNDNDIDGFYISFSGFNEGTARNNLAGASLTMTGSTATLTGLNGNDDNDSLFLDYDNDGLLDVFVASLGNTREKIYRNLGTFANASFVYQGTTGFSAQTDSTLDLSVGDYDGDGDYDIVTAQGESGNYLNRYYRNNGAADSTAPRIGRIRPIPSSVGLAVAQSGGPVALAWIQDSTYENGRNFVTAVLDVTTTKGAFSAMTSVPMVVSGGGLVRGRVQAQLPPDGLLGATVAWSITASDPVGNSTTSSVSTFVVCGAEDYGTPSAVNHLTLGSSPDATVGQTFTASVGGAGPLQTGFLAFGFGRDAAPLFGGTLYVQASGAVTVPFGTDGAGAAAIPIAVPALPALAGFVFDMQGVVYEPAQPFGWALTLGREAAVCP